MPTRNLAFLVFSASTAALCAQQTHLVPAQYATLEAAIAAAADGDRILLTTPELELSPAGLQLDKSLVIETVGSSRTALRYPAAPFAFPATHDQASLRITGLGSRGRVVLRNLDFVGGFSIWANSPTRPAVIDIQLPTQSGELVLQSVRAIADTRHSDDACPGLRLQTGPDVQLLVRDCRFEGASGQTPMFGGSGEIEYHGSPGAIGQVAGGLLAENTLFVGGAGGRASWSFLGPFWTGRNGGDALRLQAPLSALKNCEFLEGAPGAAFATQPPFPGTPDPCLSYGAPGQYSTDAQILDGVRAVVPPGCGRGVQHWPINIGDNDVEYVPPAAVGVSFRFKVRAQFAGQGLTLLLASLRTDTELVPGVAGRLWLHDPFVLNFLAPSTQFSWTDVWVPAPPAALGFLPTLAVQPLHFTNQGLRLGSFATFTVLTP
jgi:hypothetical protein